MSRQTHSTELTFFARLAGTLFAITAAAALLLAVVNGVTRQPIADRTSQRRQAAMETVVPGADLFSQVKFDPAAVTDMYAAYRRDALLGYCVELTADGFGGPIKLMVGVSAAGSVTGVSILEHNETAGLGSNADDPAFLERFIGRSGMIAIGPGRVEAVSGATVTSKAVAQGVAGALEAVAQYQGSGGGADEEGEI